MSKNKNIQASNLNVKNSQDGSMNSMGGNTGKSPGEDFVNKSNSGTQPGMADTKNKR